MRTHTQKLITKSTADASDVIIKSLKEHGDSIAKFKAQIGEDIEEVRTKSAENSVQLVELMQFVARNNQHGGTTDNSSYETPGSDVAAQEDRIALLRNGSTKSVRLPVRTFHPARTKAATNDGFPGQANRDPEWFYELTRPLSVRDLLITRQATTNTVEYVKATRSGNAGIQFDPANAVAAPSGEGALKKQLDVTFSLENEKVSTIAAWVPASRQVIDDVREMSEFINTTLLDAVREEEDAQLLYGDGVGMNLNGLIPQAAAFTRGQVGDGPNATIRRAITQIQLAKGTPTGLIVNPVALEMLELETDANGQYLMVYNVSADGRTTSWRVPVVATVAMQADQFLIGDFVRAARLHDRMQATVMVSLEYADFFVRNMVAILAEERVTLTVPRPQLLVQGEFPEAIEE